MRATFGSAKNQLARYCANGLCADDPRVLQKTNEARERLLKTDKKWNRQLQSFVTCINDGCFTLPREIITAEGFSICSMQVPIRNQLFEFLDNGPGIGSCNTNLIDRGDGWSTFRDICGARKLHVYADAEVDSTARILFQGFDENNNRIRTQDDEGVWIDGEYVEPNAYSVNLFTGSPMIQKPLTQGTVRVYAADADTLGEYAIALLHPDDTLPSLRRYELEGAHNLSDGQQVTVLGVLRYLPITRDSDYLGIENFGALKNILIALEKEDHGLLQEAALYQLRAEDLLRQELNQYLGDSTTGSFSVQGVAFGAGEISYAYL